MSIASIPNPQRGNAGAAPIAAAAIVAAAPTPADKAPTPDAPPRPAGFAELLRRNRAEASTPMPPAPATPAASAGESQDDAAQDPSSIESKAAPANAARARAATRAAGKAVVESPERRCAAVRGDGEDEAAGGSAEGGEIAGAGAVASTGSPARVDARASAPLAGDALRHPPRMTEAGIDADPGADASDRDAATGAATRPSPGHARGMALVDAANDRRASVVEASRDAALRAGTETSFHSAVAEAGQTADAPAAPLAHDRGVDALTASLAAGAGMRGAEQAPTTTATATATLALPMPVDGPDFAAALGVRVSVLAQDGVQQAELHLNPAEMGPVSIRISLDGTAARVDFGADVAATRDAIERGLPELAGALRDAGFTLAGGGVSQHADGRSASDDGRARAGRHVDAAGTTAPAAIASASGRASRHVAAGGVDLYA